MMILFRNFAEFRLVKKFWKDVKVKHRIVLTMLAKISYIFAEIHIFQVICNITTIATLDALAVNLQNFFLWFFTHFLDFSIKLSARRLQKLFQYVFNINQAMKFFTIQIHHLHHHHANHIRVNWSSVFTEIRKISFISKTRTLKCFKGLFVL